MDASAEELPPVREDATVALLVLRAVAAMANEPAAVALPAADTAATSADAPWTRAEAVATLRAALGVSHAWRAHATEAAEALTTLVPRDAHALKDLPRRHPRVTTLCLSRVRVDAVEQLLDPDKWEELGRAFDALERSRKEAGEEDVPAPAELVVASEEPQAPDAIAEEVVPGNDDDDETRPRISAVMKCLDRLRSPCTAPRLQDWSSITRLDASDCRWLTAEKLPKLVACVPSMRCLRLARCSLSSADPGLAGAALLPLAPQLRVLDVEGSNMHPASLCMVVWDARDQLEEVNIARNFRFDNPPGYDRIGGPGDEPPTQAEDGSFLLRRNSHDFSALTTLLGYLLAACPALRVLDASGNFPHAVAQSLYTMTQPMPGVPFSMLETRMPPQGNTTLKLLDVSGIGMEDGPPEVLPRLRALLPAARILATPHDEMTALPAAGAPCRLAWSAGLLALGDMAAQWAVAVEEAATPLDVALLGATTGLVASLYVPGASNAGADNADGGAEEAEAVVLYFMTLARPSRDAAWGPGPKGLRSTHVCGSPPLLEAHCMGGTLQATAELFVMRGFSTMRLYDAAGCAAAEVPPPTAAERAAEKEAGLHDDDEDAPRSGAFETRLIEALLASANAIEAAPLADVLRSDDAVPRLRAVILPPGTDIAGGDGDPALRWVPPQTPPVQL